MADFLLALSPCTLLGPAEANICEEEKKERKEGERENVDWLVSCVQLCVKAEGKTAPFSVAGLVRVHVEAHCRYVSLGLSGLVCGAVSES